MALIGFANCSDEGDGDAPAAQMDDERPVDDIEQIPGYLVDPGSVAIDPESGAVTAPADSVARGQNDVGKKLYVLIWSWFQPGAAIASTVNLQTLNVALLGSAEVAGDGSFTVPVAISGDETLICSFATSLPNSETLNIRRVVEGVLPEDGAAVVAKTLSQEGEWTPLTVSNISDYEVP